MSTSTAGMMKRHSRTAESATAPTTLMALAVKDLDIPHGPHCSRGSAATPGIEEAVADVSRSQFAGGTDAALRKRCPAATYGLDAARPMSATMSTPALNTHDGDGKAEPDGSGVA